MNQHKEVNLFLIHYTYTCLYTYKLCSEKLNHIEKHQKDKYRKASSLKEYQAI